MTLSLAIRYVIDLLNARIQTREGVCDLPVDVAPRPVRRSEPRTGENSQPPDDIINRVLRTGRDWVFRYVIEETIERITERESENSEDDDCDDSTDRNIRAGSYAQIARTFYDTLSGTVGVNPGVLKITLAFTRVRDATGTCRSIGAINNKANHDGKNLNETADIVFKQSYNGLDDFFVRGSDSPAIRGDGHAETNLYNYVTSIGVSLTAIGISNPKGPCGPGSVDCKTFFITNNVQIAWLSIGPPSELFYLF